jgi:deoxyribodipyrimidine photo-lyase
MTPYPVAIWWVRRDLRLFDNPALAAALAAAQSVIPLFVLDAHILDAASHRGASKRKAFLFGGLRQLDADLRARGSRLVVRSGAPLEVLSAITDATCASGIFAAADFSPYARRRDSAVACHLPLVLVDSLTVHHPARVVKADGSPYMVFTPFSNAWKALPVPGAPDLLAAPARLEAPPDIASEPIPGVAAPAHFLPGEAHARRALQLFAGRDGAPIFTYREGRNRLDGDGTSGLSPYLRFGMLSAREAVVAACSALAAADAGPARGGAEAWLNELIWREFYYAIAYHFPQGLRSPFRPGADRIAWRDDEPALAAWRGGRTGYPVVDAAMRQLVETGWMHNRARMITASFLVKHLLIDWRRGEQWFMQHLVDGDPAANNGGWQWTAGTGTDAAPFIRVFNPVLQSRKFDPHGDFARAWLPELRRVPDGYIHQPWMMPLEAQRRARCIIGRDYPAPIVDHAFARQRALAAHRQLAARG